jgi:hypothetical protein
MLGEGDGTRGEEGEGGRRGRGTRDGGREGRKGGRGGEREVGGKEEEGEKITSTTKARGAFGFIPNVTNAVSTLNSAIALFFGIANSVSAQDSHLGEVRKEFKFKLVQKIKRSKN